MTTLTSENRPLKLPHKSSDSGLAFLLYLFYLFDFYLHLSSRMPGYGAMRPSLILFCGVIILLAFRGRQLRDDFDDLISRRLLMLLLVVLVTLPLVAFPGSVFRYHVPDFVRALGFFFITVALVNTKKRYNILLFIYIALQLFRIFEPLTLNISSGYWGDKTFVGEKEYANRLAGAPADVINPNELGFLIVTLLPFIYYLLISHRRLALKMLGCIIVAPLLYALILTMSRGAYVASLVVAWFIWRASKHKLLLIGIGIMILIVTWSSMNFYQKDRVLSLLGKSETAQSKTASGRFDAMLAEFRLGFYRPVFGHGVGTTQEAKFNNGFGRKASHNMYAELMIEIGIVGFVFFMRFIQEVYRRISCLNKVANSGDKVDEAAVRMATLFKIVFWMFAVYSLNYYGLSQPYWYFFAALVVCYKNAFFADKTTA